MHKLLQTSWTAIFGAVAALEAIVLAWGAQHFYQVWTKTFGFVVAHWPWGSKVTEGVEINPVEAPPKRGRHRQAAIDARNE